MAEPPDWEWWYGATKDAHLPLSILQLDPADRAVLRIAGKYTTIVSIITFFNGPIRPGNVYRTCTFGNKV